MFCFTKVSKIDCFANFNGNMAHSHHRKTVQEGASYQLWCLFSGCVSIQSAECSMELLLVIFVARFSAVKMIVVWCENRVYFHRVLKTMLDAQATNLSSSINIGHFASLLFELFLAFAIAEKWPLHLHVRKTNLLHLCFDDISDCLLEPHVLKRICAIMTIKKSKVNLHFFFFIQDDNPKFTMTQTSNSDWRWRKSWQRTEMLQSTVMMTIHADRNNTNLNRGCAGCTQCKNKLPHTPKLKVPHFTSSAFSFLLLLPSLSRSP